jgi:hypothetical protein
MSKIFDFFLKKANFYLKIKFLFKENMSSYYGGFNNTGVNPVPSNFSVSAGLAINAQSSSVNYNYSLNNAGLLPSNASSSVQSGVMIALGQPANVNASTLVAVGFPSVIDNSANESLAQLEVSNGVQPVNTMQNVTNLLPSVRNVDQKTIAQGAVNIGLYPNASASNNPYHS